MIDAWYEEIVAEYLFDGKTQLNKALRSLLEAAQRPARQPPRASAASEAVGWKQLLGAPISFQIWAALRLIVQRLPHAKLFHCKIKRLEHQASWGKTDAAKRDMLTGMTITRII